MNDVLPVGDIEVERGAGTFAFINGTLKVQYATGGTCNGDVGHTILQPINADVSSVFKLGSTIPTKFRVCDANGVSIGTTGVVASFTIVGISGAATAVLQQVRLIAVPATAGHPRRLITQPGIPVRARSATSRLGSPGTHTVWFHGKPLTTTSSA